MECGLSTQPLKDIQYCPLQVISGSVSLPYRTPTSINKPSTILTQHSFLYRPLTTRSTEQEGKQ